MTPRTSTTSTSASRTASQTRGRFARLLKQLAAAVTRQQIDSLTARIHDAEASIASDQTTIRRLNQRIDFTQIALSIGARSAPVPVSHSSGFTLGKAAHDAGRVLTVAAGIALIALAAMVPLTLVGSVAWWLVSTVRHRRREQALDAA